jgi:predicted RNase H-like HicB family nuclease
MEGERKMNAEMREYLVIFEQGNDGGWDAYALDLPASV